MNPIAKILFVIAAALIVVGLILQFGPKEFQIGRLPGDIYIEKENFKFYFPITTSILFSGLISLFFYIMRKFN